jgi:hypothetical protein
MIKIKYNSIKLLVDQHEFLTKLNQNGLGLNLDY